MKTIRQIDLEEVQLAFFLPHASLEEPEQCSFHCRGSHSPWLAQQDSDPDLESVPLQGPLLGKKK